MFIIPVKSDKIKKVAFSLLVATLIIIGGTVAVMSNQTATVGNFSNVSLRGETSQERKSFFNHFGWEISDDPLEVKETVIPSEFDESYEKYNNLQKEQGFDLEKYKGVRVKAWSYEILNYPEHENSDGVIRGNLLTHNGKIIGGDVCSIELGGFMHGFASSENEATTENPSLSQ